MEDTITLEYKDGETTECQVKGVFDCEGKDYIAVEPLDGTDDVYIYGYKEHKNGTYDLSDITDDEEFAKVVKEFDSIMLG